MATPHIPSSVQTPLIKNQSLNYFQESIAKAVSPWYHLSIMAIPVRVNEELYSLLATHALADGRSIIKELEIILALYFDEINTPTPKTTKTILESKDIPSRPSKYVETQDVTRQIQELEPPLQFARSEATCKACETPLRPDLKCQVKGCKLFGKVQ